MSNHFAWNLAASFMYCSMRLPKANRRLKKRKKSGKTCLPDVVLIPALYRPFRGKLLSEIGTTLIVGRLQSCAFVARDMRLKQSSQDTDKGPAQVVLNELARVWTEVGFSVQILSNQPKAPKCPPGTCSANVLNAIIEIYQSRFRICA